MSQGTLQQPGNAVVKPRKSGKIGWAYDTLNKDVEMDYRTFCELWTKQNGLKETPPANTTFYTAKREIKMEQRKVGQPSAVPKIASPVAAQQKASVVEPTVTRPRGRPVTNKVLVTEPTTNIDKKRYEDLEMQLDEILATADRLRNRPLVDAIRHARRLTGRELLK